MARKVPKTKAAKANKMRTVMEEYKAGKLRSGSKQGPPVKSREQAIAIALSQSGQSKYRKKGRNAKQPKLSRVEKALS